MLSLSPAGIEGFRNRVSSRGLDAVLCGKRRSCRVRATSLALISYMLFVNLSDAGAVVIR